MNEIQSLMEPDSRNSSEGRKVKAMSVNISQAAMIYSGKFDNERDYWLKKLSGELTVSGFSGPLGRPETYRDTRAVYEFSFPHEIRKGIIHICNNSEYGIFMVLLTGIIYLLFKYSGNEDIILGTPVFKPEGPGVCINDTLALRNHVTLAMSFKELLMEVQVTVNEANENMNFPFHELVKLLHIQPDQNRSPLFDIMVAFKNIHNESVVSEQNCDTIFLFNWTGEYLGGEINYNNSLIDEEAVRSLSRQLVNYFEIVIKTPEITLSGIEILSKEEKQQLLVGFNNTEADYPDNKEINLLVEEQAARMPDSTAVVFEDKEITYNELNKKSNQMAAMLKENGAAPDDIIALLLKPSIDLVIAKLGVLKAKALCLPLNTKNPGNRLKAILQDSGPRVLLKQKEPNYPFDFVGNTINMDNEKINHYRAGNLENSRGKGNSAYAYVIYTSGSTGKPKGVLLHHHGIVNHAFTKIKEVGITRADILCFNLSTSFVASIWQIFTPFFMGGKLRIYPENISTNPYNLFKSAAANNIIFLEIVPSFLKSFLKLPEAERAVIELNRIKTIILTGEKVEASLVNAFYKQYKTNLLNAYGQSECSDDTLHYKIPYNTETTHVPVGKPSNNTKVYILGKDQRLQPGGAAGDLYIWGHGLAPGYLNKPELTMESFVTNPFIPGEKLYRTGDRARWINDGNVEYLGRSDHQVKIRGYRIEPGEIESKLLMHDDIKEAVVCAREDKHKENHLCAYIVLKNPGTAKGFNISELRRKLTAELPGYMIPSYFMPVDKIPLTPNGKTDRNALPAPKVEQREIEEIPPGNEIEESLGEIWSEVLGIDRDLIGINTNFFELGGNSLNIIQVSSKLKRKFDKEVAVMTLFNYPTIRSLARHLSHGDNRIILKKNKKRAIHEGKIAIIGMAGQFPGAKNIDEFWMNLKNGVESISFFTTGELLDAGVEPEWLNNPNYINAKGILDDIEKFDSDFFNYTPREAARMDPQLRVFHQCAWRALENAGYNPGAYNGLIGLYAGAKPHLYWEILSFLEGKRDQSGFSTSYVPGKDQLSTLVSYKLNLNGPAVSLQTACSTSLVAIDQACNALRSGRCDMALAGGVSVTFPNKNGYLYQEGMMESPDGHCLAFDARAQGTVFGDGVGIVVLKPLENAVEDRDHIYAVIRGTAVNNDGNRKVGYTAPSIKGQKEVIRAALQAAATDAESIGYIETHGTGTPLGDPVEIEALKQAFNSPKKGFCAVGSVKTNLGHLDAAAGVTGLIKTALVLKHRLIPPHLHFETPNPKIDFENSPFYVNRELSVWENGNNPLRAGVSSFGIGGTNAHVVLEEAPKINNRSNEVTTPAKDFRLILLSAKTPAALDQTTEQIIEYFKKNPAVNLADAAYTLQAGRKTSEHKRMLACSDLDDAVEALSSARPGRVHTHFAKVEEPPIVFMFPGVGAHYCNMGLELYRSQPVFREELDRCFNIVQHETGTKIKESFFPGEAREEHRDQPEIVHLHIFIFEYALARLLEKWGIIPGAMIGYSLGEYASACTAGVFSIKDALKLVFFRARLIRKAPPGMMLSVPLPKSKLTPLLPGELSIAVDNGPTCIVAGAKAEVEAFESRMRKKRYICTPVQNSHAVHSKIMDPLLEEFEEKLNEVSLNAPKIPYISNVTGSWVKAEDASSPGYWVKHLRQTVQFADGVKELLKIDNALFIEVGPGRELSTLIKYHTAKKSPYTTHLLRHPQENISDIRYLLNKVGHLWLRGVNIDWTGFYENEKRYRMPLPTYPFNGRHFKNEKTLFKDGMKKLSETAHGRKTDITDWFCIPSWKRSAFPGRQPFPRGKQSTWLVLVDECGLGTKMIEQLENAGQEVIEVRRGIEFDKIGSRLYTVNPRQDNHYHLLFKSLLSTGSVPDNIIHFWSLTGTKNGKLKISDAHEAQDNGFYSLISIAQAIGKNHLNHGIHFTVVSDHMQEVIGNDGKCPEKATLLGPVQVIPLEYPNIKCRSIDIILPKTGSMEEDTLIRQLTTDLFRDTNGNIVAYRNNFRWGRCFESFPLAKVGKKSQRLREKGVYLVTGGPGGIGLVLSRYLAKKVGARLILVGRTAHASRGKWEKKVRELEGLGAEVLVLTADAANAEEMQAVIHKAVQRFGTINGVVNAAGVADGAMIQRRTRQMSEPILAPKITGTLILDRILENLELKPDFIILCSSISSMVPAFGQAGYCAANAFLDAFALQKNTRQNIFTLSINWDRWQNTGISTIAETHHEKLTGGLLTDGITREEGVETFARIIEDTQPQVVVSPRDLNALIQKSSQLELPSLEQRAGESISCGHMNQRPQLDVDFVPPANKIEQTIAGLWKNYLGIEEVGVNDNFFDLGATSLDIIQVNIQLKEVLRKDIHVVKFFTNPTVSSLARYIIKGHEEKGERIPVKTGRAGEVNQSLGKGKTSLQNRFNIRKARKQND